jgi:putative transcriptional regulator
MIKCNLSRILGERRITRVERARRAGLTYQGIKPLYDDTLKGVQRNTIDVICKALDI